MTTTTHLTVRDATFQRWQTLLTNRTKRHRAGELLVQGVRPVDQAVAHRWEVRRWLHGPNGVTSRWAHDHLATSDAPRTALDPELLAELGGKEDEVPELLAVIGMPADDLDRLPVRDDALLVAFDRPTSPGNLGTLLRSIDALGGDGLVVTGHAADPYDPRSVRASTGSLFAVPCVRTSSHRDVLAWVEDVRTGGVPLQVVGTDEHGEVELPDADLAGPSLLVVGNETTGMSAGWHEACDLLVRIPMVGAASSLNAATAGSLVLYEAARQRRSTDTDREQRCVS